jgi:hypothetical protein
MVDFYVKRYIFILLTTLFFLSCTKSKQQAKPAFFLQSSNVVVDVPNALATPTNSGSHKITDLWYYLNGQFQGAYQVGKKMPVPFVNGATIDVFAGINRDGISDKKVPYPFYDRITFDTSAAAGTLVDKKMVFKYKSDAKIRFFESFEGFGTTTGISFKKSFSTDTTFTILNGNNAAFEGTRCLSLIVDNLRSYASIETISSSFPLPRNSEFVYLELNYKCNQAFEVGVYKNGNYVIAGGVNPSSEWNKIYIQMSTAVSTLPENPSDQTCGFFVRMIKSSDVSLGNVVIDNVKIVTF